MRILLAFRAFFAVLFRGESAKRVQEALEGKFAGPGVDLGTRPLPAPSAGANAVDRDRGSTSPSKSRSDALTMLMVLQRDARFLDLVNESLDAYSDEQIGSAARNVLRDTQSALNRMLGLKPVVEHAEGERIDIPADASAIRWRVLGNTTARTGRIAHQGWMATKHDLPQWTGGREDAWILAPIEVEAGS